MRRPWPREPEVPVSVSIRMPAISALFAVLALVATGAPGAAGVADELLVLVNQERRAAGIPAMTLNAALTSAAERHANDMAATGNLSHLGSDGSSVGDRVTEAGYLLRGIAENVATGPQTPEGAMQNWMNSAGHKTNILNGTYRDFGAAKAVGGRGRPYWVQVFGTPQ